MSVQFAEAGFTTHPFVSEQAEATPYAPLSSPQADSITPHSSRSASLPPFPLLNFHCANNVCLWLDARRVLKDYGKQYFYRVQLYSSFWVLSMLGLLAYLAYQFIFERVADSTGLTLIAYDLIVLLGVLVAMLRAAIRLNEQHVRITETIPTKEEQRKKGVPSCGLDSWLFPADILPSCLLSLSVLLSLLFLLLLARWSTVRFSCPSRPPFSGTCPAWRPPVTAPPPPSPPSSTPRSS
jgi:hypothetical protein